MTVLVHAHARTEFTHVTDRVPSSGVHVKSARAMHIVPLGLVLAVAVENLHAMILPVSDVNPAVLIGADIVNDIELTGIAPGFALREKQFSIGRVFVHAGIAVRSEEHTSELQSHHDLV